MKKQSVIIYLIGKPGVGKYTIATELSKQTGYAICDNHLMNNPIFQLLQYDGHAKIPELAWDAIADIRTSMLSFLAKHKVGSYILTNCLADNDEDRAIYEEVLQMANLRGSIFVPVCLQISKEQHLKRVIRPERKSRLKSTNPKEAEDNSPLITINHPNLVNLDVSDLAANVAAKKIIYSLP